MTITESSSTTKVESFDSFNPATGEVIGTFPICTAAQVNEAVERARRAAGGWAALGYTARGRILRAWQQAIVRRADELVDLVHAENGKPHDDAMLEIVLAAQHIDWARKNARKVLGPRKVSSGFVMMNQSAWLEYQPIGVIGVLGPWDYPVFGPVGSVGYALAGGNTAVLKHSENTPAVGDWLAASFAEVSGNPDLFQAITGPGSTGADLCRSGVNKIGFTGCVVTAKKVMAVCAETLTPVVVDSGGSDAMLVDEDADLAAAADAAVWGGMSNAGQTCVAIERVYVHERVYETFTAKVVAIAQGLTAGPDGPIGPMTTSLQVAIVRRHIVDALERGATALVGGVEAVGERYIQPTVLVNVPEDAAVVREETFGPILTITKVADMDEAVDKANGTDFGLGGAVFSRARGMELARRMRSGMTSINGVITYAAVPSLPYGGVGGSGFGRIHGPDGLREWTQPKAITRQRFSSPLRTTTFTRRAKDNRWLKRLTRLLYGGR